MGLAVSDMKRIIAKITGCTHEKAGEAWNAISSAVITAVVQEGICRVPDICTIKRVERPDRVCRNPKTGKSLHIPAHFAGHVSLPHNFKRIIRNIDVNSNVVTSDPISKAKLPRSKV